MDVVSVTELPNDIAERLRHLPMTDTWFAELETIASELRKSWGTGVSASDAIADVRE